MICARRKNDFFKEAYLTQLTELVKSSSYFCKINKSDLSLITDIKNEKNKSTINCHS